MALSSEQFLNQVVASELLAQEDVSAFISAIPDDRRPKDGEQLARELVRQKKLTKYQAEQIYSGKGKTLILGNYVVLDKLGQGGMGVVLKAEHKRLKRLVALKVMSSNLVKTPDALKRFHREVEAAAKLRHSNVVATDDADEAKGTHFLVMEYVEGSDLSALVKKNGPLSVSQAVKCILQAARGLEYAHKQGVVHRDIKPANLLLDTSGTVKILDMGLARIEGDTGSQGELTSTGAVMGTVDYMAPEQALSTKHADARSDIYSLGISLWYLLAGRCAYEGDSLMAKLLAHRDAPIPSLCSLDSEIPETLDQVFRKMVAKQSKDRYQTMTEVIRELESCQNGSTSALDVAAPNNFEDPSLQSFLSQLGDKPSTSGATRKSTETATRVKINPAAEATMLNGNIGVDTDPQTLVSARKQERQARRGSRLAEAQAASPPWYRDKRILLGGATAAALILVAVVTLMKTPHGTLRVEILDPEVEMKVKGTELTFQSTDIEPVSLMTGDKKLIVTRGDLTFETETFTLKKGTETRVKVELIGDKLVVNDGANVIAEQPIASMSVVASARGGASESSLQFAGDHASKSGLVGGGRVISDDPDRDAANYVLSVGGTVQINDSSMEYTDVRELPNSRFRLTSIILHDRQQVSAAGLAACRGLQHLTQLQLSASAPVGDAGLEPFRQCKKLKRLALSGTQLTDAGLAYFSGCGDLIILSFHEHLVTDPGLAIFRDCRKLEALDMAHMRLTEKGLRHFLDCPNLQSLTLSNTPLGEHALTQLMRFPKLKSLSLVNEGVITNADLISLPNLKELTFLHLNATQVDDTGIEPLKKLTNLSRLNLYGTRLTAAGLAELTTALPNCKIETDIVAATNSVEFLTLIDVQRDAGVGNWKRAPDGIACENPDGANVLQLPYEPPEEYDFEIEFTATANGLNVNQYVAAGGQIFAWKLNSHGVNPPLYGFELLDGKFAKDNKEAAVQIPDLIKIGQRYQSTVQVRRGSLRTLLDGKELVNWSGDFKRFSTETVTPMKYPGRIGIGSWRRPVTFHSVMVREVSGKGNITTNSSETTVASRWDDWLGPAIDRGVFGRNGWSREKDGVTTDQTIIGEEVLPKETRNGAIRATYLLRNSRGIQLSARARNSQVAREFNYFAEDNGDKIQIATMVLENEYNLLGELDVPKNIPKDAARTLEFRVVDDVLTLTLNNSLVLTVKDRTQADGLFAVAATKGLLIQKVEVQALDKPTPTIIDAAGWRPLFNGKNLAGWKSQGGNGWLVRKGILTGKTSQGKDPGWLMSEQEFTDYELELEFRLSTGSNSGIFPRAFPTGNISGKDFVEVQLLDDQSPEFASLPRSNRTGGIFGKVAPNPTPVVPANQWHRVRFKLQEKTMELSINDVVVIKQPITDLPAAGHIGLQLYPTQVEFRNIRVRENAPNSKNAGL